MEFIRLTIHCFEPSVGVLPSNGSPRAESALAHWAAESGSKLARENGLRMWDFLLGALQV
jgi:hypothetical protein